MAMPETALTPLTDAQVELLLKNVDTTGMSMEDKRALAMVIQQDLEASRQGFDFRPQRYKINKDNQTFTDPLGNAHDELRGVVLHKQKVRALWKQGENVPLCSSLDCITGADRDGKKRSCSGCPYDAWGSASDNAEERRGKACKEMRRIYLVEQGGFLPILITLPPTSIKPWDDFCSARATMGISDLSAEVILRLIPGKTNSFTYSVIQPKNGSKIPPADILRYFQMRQKFVEAWQKAEITADDYDTGDMVASSTEVPADDVPF
ncbi:MAG: hypothetical protein ACPLRU_00210 [Desulfofundulus sp.]